MKFWLTGLLLTLNLNVLADDDVIYRWLDKNNVVHFSQNQPATGHYTEMVMTNTKLKKDNTVKNVLPSTIPFKTEDKTSKKIASNPSERCEEAKKNLQTLGEFHRIRFVDAKGETQILDKAEQEEQITINKNIIDTYCKSSSAKK